MSKAATIADLLDLKQGHRSQGVLKHRACGGQVIYSFLLDRIGCNHCGVAWRWAWVHDQGIVKAKGGLYIWEPPVDYETGNAI